MKITRGRRRWASVAICGTAMVTTGIIPIVGVGITADAATKASKASNSCAAPLAPASASAVAGANQATVTWTAPTSNGTTVTGYIVREASGPDAGLSQSAPATSTSATMGSLAGGSAATFTVAAESACGDGPTATTAKVSPTGGATTFAGSVLADHPAAYYRLTDQAASPEMADSSGNNSDGTLTGQQSVGTGALPNDPDTSSSYDTCCNGIGSGSPTLPLYNSARTVETWFKTTSTNGSQGLVWWGSQSTDDAFLLSMSPDSINVSGWSDNHSIVTPYPVNDGNWHMVDVTYGGSQFSVYLDGQLIGTGQFNSALNTQPSGVQIDGGPSENMFDGSMQEVSIYPAALTGAAISAQFKASGYSRPTAAGKVHAAPSGPNSAVVSWTQATASNTAVTGYLVTVVSGNDVGESVAVPGDATAASLSGLAPGAATFRVKAQDQFGFGSAVVSQSVNLTGPAAPYASVVQADAPTNYYRLGDTTTTILSDSSGHANNGWYVASNVRQGLAGAIPGDRNTSVGDQSNQDGYAYVPGGYPLFNSGRTFELWINSTTYQTGRWILTSGAQNTDQGFDLAETSPSTIEVSAYNDDHYFNLPYAIDDGNWHMLDVTTNGTSITVYLDGHSVGSEHWNGGLDTLPGPLYLGNYFGGGGGIYDTQLQDLSIYPVALTATRVATHFKASGYSTPSAPASPAATGGTNQATVTWAAASSTGNNPLLGYLVTAISGTSKSVAVSVPTTSPLTATVGGLASGNYTFTVQAVNGYGPGASATTAAVTVTGAATTYASTVLADGPSAYFRMGDTDSAFVADSSGNASRGSYIAANTTLGSAGAIPGDPTTSVADKDQSSGYITSSASSPLYSNPRTVEIWLESTTYQTDRWLFTSGENTTDEGFNLLEVNPSILDVSAVNDDHDFSLPYAIDDGVWHLISVTFNGTAITVFLDGKQVGTSHFSGSVNTLPGGLNIGSFYDQGGGIYDTDLQDFSLYPSALTSAQITAQFAASGYSRPSAPGAPSATGASNQATVTWTPAAADNAPVEGYLVTAVSGTTKLKANSVSVPASAGSATVGGLAAGSYTFTIQGVNAYGLGAAATTAAATVAGTNTTYASTVLSDGPAVYYRLGDSSTALAADSSGAGLEGSYITANVVQGQPGAIPGDPTTSTADNGQQDGYVVSSVGEPIDNSARTFEVWMKTSSNQAGRWLYTSGSQASDQAFDIYLDNSSEIDVDAYSDAHFIGLPYAIDDGNWHLLDVTLQGQQISVYLDGVLAGTSTLAGTLDTTSSYFDLGSYFGGGDGITQTDLQDFALYPTALTAARVAAHFSASTYGQPSAPASASATAGTNQATVTFSAPATSNPAPTGYLVSAVAGGVKENAVSVPATATTATIGGLAAGSYTFDVQAINPYGVGVGKATASVDVTGTATTYASTVLSDAPSQYYRLGDTDSSFMADSSGNKVEGGYLSSNVSQGQTGAIPADPTTSTGDHGQGNGYGSAPTSPLYSAPRTYEFWMETTTSQSRWIYSSGQANTDEGFGLYEDGPSTLDVSAVNDDHYFNLPHPIDDGSWHLIDVTTNGVQLTLYLDGVEVGTSEWTGQLDTLPGGLDIGAYYGGGGIIGTDLQDFAVYPEALTAARVAAHFAAAGYSVPAAPTSVSASPGTNEATVQWKAPAGGANAYLVTALSGTTRENAVSAAGTSTTAIIGGLPAGKYTFTIQAENTYGLGAAATTASATVTGTSSTYASTVRSLGPTGYYELGDNSPALLADSSGSKTEGAYIAQSVTQGQGGPIQADPTGSTEGNGNYMGYVLNAAVPLYNQPRTVEAWIKTTSGGTPYIAGWGVQGTGQAFDVSFDNTDVIVRGYNDDLDFPTLSGVTLENGNWHFIAVTATATSATVYVDGSAIGTQTFPTALDTLSSGELVVGGYTTGCCGISGDEAQLAIFPSALTATQISNEYSTGTAAEPARLEQPVWVPRDIGGSAQ